MANVLIGEALAEAKHWLDKTAEVARGAGCGRAQCGTVIVNGGEVIAEGVNSPPAELESQRRCDKKHELKAGFKSDRTCCIHAEQRAVMNALRTSSDNLAGSTLYFCRVDENGERKISGRPYCTICSKMALDAGVGFWVLEHAEGITKYAADEYNDISFEYDGT